MTVPMYCLFLAAVCFTIAAATGLLKLIDDSKVGVGSGLANSSLGVDGNDTRPGADTRPYDRELAS